MYDRRKIIRVSQISQCIFIFALAFTSFNGLITKERFLLLILFIAIAHAFEGPPLQSLLPNIVDREIFPRASALMSSASEFAVIVGPSAGGIIYSFGSGLVYALAGFMLFISSILISQISIRKEEKKIEARNLKNLLGGITFIKSKPIILAAISIDLFVVLFGGVTALLPIYASSILMIGSFGLGVLRSAPAIGALLMSAFLVKKPLKKNVGKIMFSSVFCFGLATIVFAISKSVVISFVALLILGAADVISVVIRSTLVQLETPDNMRGRVSSVNMIFIGTSNQLGEFESGITASLFGTVPAAIFGGAMTLILVLAFTKIFPTLLNVDKFESIKSES
jgi:MFS family permease